MPFGEIDFSSVQHIAEEQSVLGLLVSGIEHVSDKCFSKQDVLPLIGSALQLEKRNLAMNKFIGDLFESLSDAGIFALLVKGQGVAQCYQRPLLRACGDVDLFLDNENYEKAKTFLIPKAESTEVEFLQFKHLGMSINGWVVELHGTLRPRLTKRIDRIVDELQETTFINRDVREWNNEGTIVCIPGVNNDLIFLFTHILKHFYQGGIGLRQICDWCRFLWTFNDIINQEQLELRLRSMKVLKEWKAFASYAVDFLGMPIEKMPLYSCEKKWSKKAKKINAFIMRVGNFGQKRLTNHDRKNSVLVQKVMSFWQRTIDSFNHFFIFPHNALSIWLHMVNTGLSIAVKGH